MDPATSANGRTRRYQRETPTQEGRGVPAPDGRPLPEAPRRTGAGSAAVSGMNDAVVNATMSFVAPMTAEQVRRGVGPRPRTDVIARIKSNTKTHRGTPRPTETQERRITGDYEKPNETAASQQRPLDRDTLQELVAVDEDDVGTWGANTSKTRSFAAPKIRPPSQPTPRAASAPTQRPASAPSQRTPLRRAPDAVLHPAPRTPAPELTQPDMTHPRQRRRQEPQARWPVTAIVVSTLLAALVGGLIAMAATGG